MKKNLHIWDGVPTAGGIYTFTGRMGAGPINCFRSMQLCLLLCVLLISNSAVASHLNEIATTRSGRLENGSRNYAIGFQADECTVQVSLKAAAKACGGSSNGMIELAGTNGTAPFTYSLNNGSTFQSSSMFENLSSGTYMAVVKDANNCVSSPLQINLTNAPLPSVTLSLPITSFCVSANAVEPTGGFPAGGFYSGPGMLRGKFSPSRAGVGTHVLTYSYANADGCIGTASQTITVHPFAKVSAGPDKAVYAGQKSASCTTLTASMDINNNTKYTYRWSTGATTQAIEVCPKETTTYTVTATDLSGCSSTDEVTVTVDDVRCGSNLDKISVCHNGKVLCVAPEAVEAHLAHGDVLGSCAPEKAVSTTKEAQVEVYPNPVKNKAQVKLQLNTADVIRVEIVNASGKVVRNLYEGSIAANQELILTIDRNLGKDKLYIGRLITSQGVQLFKIFTE